jgi:putative membrane protein
MWWNYGLGWGFPFFILIKVLFFVLILSLIFGRWRGRGHYSWHGEKSAEEILKERFAKGEVDEKEYQERLGVLKKAEK